MPRQCTRVAPTVFIQTPTKVSSGGGGLGSTPPPNLPIRGVTFTCSYNVSGTHVNELRVVSVTFAGITDFEHVSAEFLSLSDDPIFPVTEIFPVTDFVGIGNSVQGRIDPTARGRTGYFVISIIGTPTYMTEEVTIIACPDRRS